MKPLIFLFLILTTISNIKGDYSIEAFLNYLQEKGLYDLLVEVKSYFGVDVSIEFCKELIKSYECETVIRVYISTNCPGEHRQTNIKNPNQIINENRMALIKAGYTLEEIEEMRRILMKAA